MGGRIRTAEGGATNMLELKDLRRRTSLMPIKGGGKTKPIKPGREGIKRDYASRSRCGKKLCTMHVWKQHKKN